MFLDKAIEKEPYESKLYLYRAEVKKVLEDINCEKKDMEISNTLGREKFSLTLNEIPQKNNVCSRNRGRKYVGIIYN